MRPAREKGNDPHFRGIYKKPVCFLPASHVPKKRVSMNSRASAALCIVRHSTICQRTQSDLPGFQQLIRAWMEGRDLDTENTGSGCLGSAANAEGQWVARALSVLQTGRTKGYHWDWWMERERDRDHFKPEPSLWCGGLPLWDEQAIKRDYWLLSMPTEPVPWTQSCLNNYMKQVRSSY